MPRLIAALVRHGAYQQLADTPSAHQPFPLVAEGAGQAHAGGEWLRQQLLEQQLALCPQVDSSRLLRAWQTAQVMLEPLQGSFAKPPQIECFDELAERCVGSLANLSIAQIEAVVREDPRYPPLPPNWKSDSRFRLPLQGAESLLEAGERVAGHLRTRMAALAGTVSVDTLKLFVGHGAAFRHAAYHLGVLDFEDLARLSMHHAQAVLLEYEPTGDWRHVGGHWKVRGQGSTFKD